MGKKRKTPNEKKTQKKNERLFAEEQAKKNETFMTKLKAFPAKVGAFFKSVFAKLKSVPVKEKAGDVNIVRPLIAYGVVALEVLVVVIVVLCVFLPLL